MLESYYENKLRLAVESVGGRCLKFESPGFSGVPDRIILLPGGKILFAELKQPNKTERRRQRYVHEIFRALGFTVYNTVDSLEKIQAIQKDCERLVNQYVQGL